MLIGGKKIYILCRKDCIGCGRGEIPVKEKKSNIRRTHACMISILVCCPPIQFRGGIFPLLSQRAVSREMEFGKLNVVLTTGEFSRQKFF